MKRKKVQRDIIFKYLASEGVVIPTNSDKHQLVKATLEFWSSGKVIKSRYAACITGVCTEMFRFRIKGKLFLI